MILEVSVCVVEPPLDMSRPKSYCSIDMRFSAVNAKPHSNIHKKSHKFFHETIKGRMLCDLVSMLCVSHLICDDRLHDDCTAQHTVAYQVVDMPFGIKYFYISHFVQNQMKC